MLRPTVPARAGLACVVAAAVLSGCGGSDSSGSSSTSATTTQATATAPATTTQATTTTTATPAPAPATAKQGKANVPRKVKRKPQTLTVKKVSSTIAVTKVVDPMVVNVDRAQPGNKLVAIFLDVSNKGQVASDSASAVLTTSDGAGYPPRIISDGPCSGPSIGAALSKRPQPSLCVGFEVPKAAKLKTLRITLTTGLKKTKSTSGDWPLSS